MYDDDLYTVVEIKWNGIINKFEFLVNSYSSNVWVTEEGLRRPPAKLEFGYCAVGDVVEDDDHELFTIEAVEQNIFAYRWFDRVAWVTYAQANKEGWKIKEEEKVGETITHNGKTYKLVE